MSDTPARRDDGAVWITRIAPGASAPGAVAPGAAATGPGGAGPLAGMTLAVKDNIDVAGVPTTAGHPAFAYTPSRSAPAVQRLVDAGAVVIGKTNLDQFATGLVGTRSPYGACRNPIVVDRIAGGSSSGSAVAVATGEADLGLSTDTAGSGRVPAALCGLVGVKPTRGLVSTVGVVPAVAGLDCVGVMARHVAAAAAAMAAAAGFDPDDPWSRRPPPGSPIPGATLRVGIPRSPDGLDRPAVDAWNVAMERLASLGPLDDVDLAPYVAAGELLYGGALVAARWHAFGEFLADHPRDADPTVAAIVTPAAELRAHHLVADLEQIQTLRRRFEPVWSAVDVIAVPTVGSAPTLEEVARDPVGVNASLGRWTAGANLLDLCAVAVPCGRRGDGVPFGVTLLAPAWADAVAMAAAARLLGEPDPAPAGWAGWATVVVVGAHLSGQPLNGRLTCRGGRLVREIMTAPCYRLYALDTDPPKPGLVRAVDGGGASIAAELWSLPITSLGELVREIPSPLCIGTIALSDGTEEQGFVCESWAAQHATDITAHRGWVAYLRNGQP